MAPMSTKKKAYPIDPETGLEYEPLPDGQKVMLQARNARIRHRKAVGSSVAQLAQEFGISKRMIYRVLAQKTIGG